MVTQKERLIEILSEKIYPKEGVDYAEVVADFLIDRGVVVLPCKEGDTVYYLSGISGELIKSAEVEEITINDSSWCVLVCSDMFIRFTLQEDEVYFTREEAEAALKKMEGEK